MGEVSNNKEEAEVIMDGKEEGKVEELCEEGKDEKEEEDGQEDEEEKEKEVEEKISNNSGITTSSTVQLRSMLDRQLEVAALSRRAENRMMLGAPQPSSTLPLGSTENIDFAFGPYGAGSVESKTVPEEELTADSIPQNHVDLPALMSVLDQTHKVAAHAHVQSAILQKFAQDLGGNSGVAKEEKGSYTKPHESNCTEAVEAQDDLSVDASDKMNESTNANVIAIESDQSVSVTTDSESVSTTSSNDKSVESSDKLVESSDKSVESQSSVDSWQMLGEDERVTSDEMVAQAAQLLGSALFQSDVISDLTEMRGERPMASNKNSVSDVSVEGSVPGDASTIVSREISPVVLSRWDTELKELHELGFLDDEKNVNALGHLEAANMGVESDDPVTVNDAVNYLLSKYNEQL